LKGNPLSAGRFALHRVATAAAFTALLLSTDAQALGLGRLNVQSALGESLRAEIDISSLTPEEASGLQVKVASPETYRAAGVDYNSVLPSTAITLQRRADGRPYLKIGSDRAVQEPFVDVILELSWSTGRLVREYTLLFDPPREAAVPAPATAPVVVAPAPVPAPVAQPKVVAPEPQQTDLAVARPKPTPAATDAAGSAKGSPASKKPAAPAPAPQAAASAAERPASTAQGASEVRVQRGDTLSRIAGRAQREGVSLDQMLVGLYRANPDAFVDNNMNRLKSGVVLNVPSNEQLTSVSKEEAHRVIQAQSSDFNAYRQHLASTVPAQTVDKPQRKAAGQVQAEVKDSKQPATPTPDKLTLSKGGVAPQGKAASVEDRLAKDRAQKDNAARVAELSKNVQDLKKLQGAASAAPAASTVAKVVPAKPAAPVVASAPAPAPAPMVASAPVVKPASASPVAPAPAVASAPQLPSAASEAASASLAAASSVDTAQAAASAASEPASAEAPAVVASKPVVQPPPPPPPAPEEPGFLDSLTENPLLLPGAGALVAALLGGFAFYKIRSRRKTDSGETSFLESRLQPDSFFGASGGQRIDTRDASGAPSSMSYSLSQLDAIGDVDPVAEADVYLAYGRDLQAEEILKEAMRTTPERLAIRTKLLEVYAKRRDTKGFEQLATQLFGLTGGQGEDWAKAQELGLSIDPENPMYAPGGQPSGPIPGGDKGMAEPLGASTMPYSASPAADELVPVADDGAGVDLDLDISSPGAFDDAPMVSKPVATNVSLDLPDLTPVAAPAPAPASNAGPLEFDLSDISLDLNTPATPAAPEVSELPSLDLGGDQQAAGLDDGDPLARKIELAEEFRQIGDVEGARDLLQEVISKSSGALKSKAQSMLDSLS
jgi:pilus assembly protein FimV